VKRFLFSNKEKYDIIEFQNHGRNFLYVTSGSSNRFGSWINIYRTNVVSKKFKF